MKLRYRILLVILTLLGIIISLLYLSQRYLLYSQINYIWLIPVLILSALFLVLCSVRVKFFVEKLTTERVTLIKSLKFELLGRALYIISPLKIYLPVRGLLLSKYLNTSFPSAVTATSFEFILDNSLLILVSFCLLLILPVSLPHYIFWPLIILTACLLSALVIVFVFNSIRYKPSMLLIKIQGKIHKNSLMLKLFGFAIKLTTNLEHGVKQLVLMRKNFLPALVLSLCIFLAMSFKMWFLFNVIGVNVNITFVLFALSVSTLISILSMVPGGIGVRELAGITVYTFLGVKPELAAIVLVLDRFIGYALILAGSSYVIGELGFNFIKQISKKQ